MFSLIGNPFEQIRQALGGLLFFGVLGFFPVALGVRNVGVAFGHAAVFCQYVIGGAFLKRGSRGTVCGLFGTAARLFFALLFCVSGVAFGTVCYHFIQVAVAAKR